MSLDILSLNSEIKNRNGILLMPYSPLHAMEIQVSNPEVLGSGKSAAEHMNCQAALGPAITAVVNNSPLAVFGFIHYWSGMAEFWSMFDDRMRRYPKSMTHIARQFLYIAERSEVLHRLQITVKSDDIRAYRWAKALGFEEEGLMRKFLPDGSDSYMMARIRDEWTI
jgi:hypothetical protein